MCACVCVYVYLIKRIEGSKCLQITSSFGSSYFSSTNIDATAIQVITFNYFIFSNYHWCRYVGVSVCVVAHVQCLCQYFIGSCHLYHALCHHCCVSLRQNTLHNIFIFVLSCYMCIEHFCWCEVLNSFSQCRFLNPMVGRCPSSLHHGCFLLAQKLSSWQ